MFKWPEFLWFFYFTYPECSLKIWVQNIQICRGLILWICSPGKSCEINPSQNLICLQYRMEMYSVIIIHGKFYDQLWLSLYGNSLSLAFLLHETFMQLSTRDEKWLYGCVQVDYKLCMVCPHRGTWTRINLQEKRGVSLFWKMSFAFWSRCSILHW